MNETESNEDAYRRLWKASVAWNKRLEDKLMFWRIAWLFTAVALVAQYW